MGACLAQIELASMLMYIETMNVGRNASSSSPLVRWDFARDRQHVMCTVQRRRSDSFYEVAIVPLWNIGCAAIETFTTATAALRRHAMIAAELRDAGWRVAAYST
jgi:hypothetical protein